ncbi:MAG: BspA family leucine-rich repeat surface protein [bacterium]|nr:BspA family leucine-rich repeat surface protein [bacterium]
MMQTFYRATNGVTVLCPAAAVGDTGVVDGVTYTKRDRAALNALVTASPTDEVELARSCTTGVTDLSELFGEANGGSRHSDPTTFNPDLSSWDVSSVTNMTDMFAVRVPPPRVLLLLRCCVVLVPHPYPLAPTSLLTPHGRPSLAAL